MTSTSDLPARTDAPASVASLYDMALENDALSLADRLTNAGFADVVVTERTGLFKFRAHVPA